MLTVALVLAFVPSCPGDPEATGRRELSAFARPQVWLTLLAGAIGLWVRWRAGGLTGDAYGAAIELCELGVLIAARFC